MEQQVTARPAGDDEPRTGRIVVGAGVPAPRRSPSVPPLPVAHRGPATASWPAPHPSFPPVPAPPSTAWPAPAPPAPAVSSGLRALVVVAVTVVALAALALAGVLLYPRLTATTPAPVVSAPAPTTVVVPSPATSGSAAGSGTTAGAYSCGSANGYAITVNNGNVPCTSARWVTTMWTTDGTTPMSGTGPAGTPYSWTCSSASASTDAVGSCVSKMGSTFTISR